ncbi:uncharacterized protein LTHEOB_5311 [Lasiodiplodia theobromae]|uniref:uncharacterized protein n=1 Tax=Lasiodiplodia theobromae TaxID=45133 RepID=UPI0015C30BE3|nr:uncharacterized protein LTHEOB_5311 [Lasiodiplodia theobromae]KAF4545478.1 hypothetical protein LTHEOB_5311 [Lasiodiplodia theobromae]
MANQEAPVAPPAYGSTVDNSNLTVPTTMQDLETSRTVSMEKDLGNSAAPKATQKPVPINPRLLQNPVTLDQLDESPRCIDCPHCHQRTMTRISQQSSSQTGTTALLCCLLLGVIGACIPYCCKMYYDTDHFCQSCGQRVVHKPHDGPPQLCFPLPPHPTAPPKAVIQEKSAGPVVN